MFVEKYFEYNPDEHVRHPLQKSSLKPDVENLYDSLDKYRPTLDLLKGKISLNKDNLYLSEIFDNRETYNAVMYLLNHKQDLLKKVAEHPDKYRTALIPLKEELHLAEKLPPSDTFHRWGYYTEVNMEEIRNTVSVLYDEKPELDLALQIYDTFKGTEEEVTTMKKKMDIQI